MGLVARLLHALGDTLHRPVEAREDPPIVLGVEARVRVTYRPAARLIAHVAKRLVLLDP